MFFSHSFTICGLFKIMLLLEVQINLDRAHVRLSYCSTHLKALSSFGLSTTVIWAIIHCSRSTAVVGLAQPTTPSCHCKLQSTQAQPTFERNYDFKNINRLKRDLIPTIALAAKYKLVVCWEIEDARTMWKETRDRESGKLRPNLFSSRVSHSRLSSIQLSNYKEIVSSHRGSVNSIQVDLTEGRYLLAGASDASVAIYDIQQATDYNGGGLIARHKSIFFINKQQEHSHKYAVSSAIWYPVDTGLIITGSYDHHVNVWDTNTGQAVINFKMPGKVYRTAMSSLARAHMLIAAGTEDVQVRLCDIASGAFAHTLSGHRDGVMSLEWSTSSEWILITGGCDGAIRFWDIRRAGCFQVLDQSHSQFGRRPPLSVCSATNKKLSSASTTGKFRMPHRKLSYGNPLKFQSVGRLSSQVKTSKQRLHPGMLSGQEHGTAHYGTVTGLRMTEDGMYLLSAGSDSRLRLWDILSGCNTLVNFETSRLQNSKSIQLAVSQNSNVAFVPCMGIVKAFDIWSGQAKWTFRGHYENVNCCWYNGIDQELYTGGSDRQILVWSPPKFVSAEVDEWRKGTVAASDQDSWSD